MQMIILHVYRWVVLGSIITGIDGKFLSQEECEVLKHPLINGVILFARNYEDTEQLLALTNSIKAIKPNLLVSVDHEGGRVQRFVKGFSQLPSMSNAFLLENTEQKPEFYDIIASESARI